MKRSMAIWIAVAGSFLAGITLAYVVGERAAAADKSDALATLAAGEMANTLLALRFIEMGEVEQAKRLLQSETSGQLGWVMEASKGTETLHCAALNTLKDYRQKRHLFDSSEWSEYRALPGKVEDEKARLHFLESMRCGNVRLFQVEDKPAN
jgi:hypothetical protein